MKKPTVSWINAQYRWFLFTILNVALMFPASGLFGQNMDFDLNGNSASKPGVNPKPTQVTAETSAPNSQTSDSGHSTVEQVKITNDGGNSAVNIIGENLPEPSVDQLSKQKLRLEFKNTSLKIPASKKGKGIVKSVRSAVHPGHVAWIVLDVTKVETWKSTKTDNGYSIALNPQENVPQAPPSVDDNVGSKEEQTGKRLFSRLMDLSLKPVEKAIKLVLTADGPCKYTVRKLSRPEKLVIRFHDTKLDIAEKTKGFKNDDVELQKGGLLNIELRQIGPGFSPMSEAILTLLPGTVTQIDRDLNQIVISLTGPNLPEKPIEKKGDINQLISLDVTSADLNAVVKTLTTEAGFDLDFPAGPIFGVVNEKFRDVPLKTVLGTLLSSRGYAYEVQGNTLRIAPVNYLHDTKILMPHITELISPSGGMAPAQFDQLVRSILNPSNAVITKTDTVRNLLVLNGTPADIEDYKRTIKDLKLDESSTSDRITRVIQLNYADPTQTIQLLTPYLTPVGKVQQVIGPQNAPTNKLVIWETASNMGVLLELIKEIDIKPPQVLIESNIVEVDDEKSLNFGINWSATKSVGQPTMGVSFNNPPANAIGNPANFAFGTIQSGLDINANLQMLQSSKRGKIISRPRVATESGVPAEINAVETVIYESTSILLVPSAGTQTTTTFNSLPLPVDLKVTPRITDDGRITSVIVATVTSVNGSALVTPTGTSQPPTSTQTATTTITTKNGETIVIGGLVRDTYQDIVNGIPLLSGIPLIGGLFQQNEKQDIKEELVIFITPTLLED